LKLVHLNSIFPGSIINVGYPKAVTTLFYVAVFLNKKLSYGRETVLQSVLALAQSGRVGTRRILRTL